MFFVFLDTYVNIVKNLKSFKEFHLDVSIYWRYLYQDPGKTYSELSKMRTYWKYVKATICRHMKKNIESLVLDLRKNN